VIFARSTTPTQNPTRSYSPGWYMSLSSAISPPISAHPASSQPFATPCTTVAITSATTE
jgi:hypothetical protein